VKFIHCADVHLDSPMRGLARYEGAPVERLRGASRRAFEHLVELAIAEHVDLVVIAGDLYDGERDDFQTAMFLQRQLHVLGDAGIPVAIAFGNHDAANAITTRLDLPAGSYAFPHDHPGTWELDGPGVALHGRSYPSRAVPEDLTLDYPAPVPGVLNVGVLHTSLDGRPGHDTYAPCTLEGLVGRGYQYWALGHVHRREHLQRAGVHVVFPGNLCGRDVGEIGPKGATVVEYHDETVDSVEHRNLAPVRWAHLEADVRAASSAAGAIEQVVAELTALQDAAPDDLLAARVTLRTGPAASDEWLRHPERYEAQLRADATGGGEALWLERIELAPSPSASGAVPGEALAAIGEALTAMRSGPAGRGEVADLLAGLRSHLGPELKEVVRLGAEGLDDSSFDRLLDGVEALLTAELGGAPGTAPGRVLGGAPGTTSGRVLGTAPGTAPGTASGRVLGTAPGTALGGAPGTAPGTASGRVLGGAPGTALGRA